jgi:hypothetical protein
MAIGNEKGRKFFHTKEETLSAADDYGQHVVLCSECDEPVEFDQLNGFWYHVYPKHPVFCERTGLSAHPKIKVENHVSLD